MKLSLDLASTCGWAVGSSALRDPILNSGTWNIKPRRGESPGMRYIRLRSKLQEVHAAYPDLSVVYYEQAHHRGGAATEYAAGCVATVQAWCAEKGLEHASVHSATIKKCVTGSGNAKKDRVIAAIRERGYSPADDNEADAIGILLTVGEGI